MHTVRNKHKLVSRLRRVATGLTRTSGSCAVVCVLAIAVVGVFGCREDGTTLSAEARSPDGRWVASAFSKQIGGPGTSGLYTSVYLKRTDTGEAPIECLDFSIGELASQSGTLNLTMTWQSPTRLDVTYNGRAATLYPQVAKCAGIDILTRDVSDKASSQPR
jgi:hypothetical protein